MPQSVTNIIRNEGRIVKLGYKRLLVFMLAIITTLSVNAFFVNFLSGYKMIIFVIALIVFFKFYFVLEKDRHRYLKDILLPF